ncbi:putative polysaccharide biosynthesis protein [Salimicrobium flavidum]|uniref:Polysaccharide transporter, PST family n=1 Tax=Salimicrobium flavidum TaxID=570947 RepID=A0A1N7KL25_9BACI|nr:polysaccharide biosynthesis protein [Salimicrobium flavidum]SIS62140.1 polysaccharide transporter, PST family [Salimicrobium flavidum]
MKNNWMRGTAWLIMAGIIGKILSAGYRIPLQNFGGDIGFYVYQQIYPVVGIGIVFALQGVPAAVSRVVAEDRQLSVPFFYRPVLIWLSAFFFVFAVTGYIQASSIALFMGDGRLTASLKVAFLALLLVPFLAVLRGGFQGYEDMKTTAISQLLEQFVRVGGILVVSIAVYLSGNVYTIGTGTAVAAAAGMVIAIVYLAGKWRKNPPRPSFKPAGTSFYYVKRVLFYSVLMSVNYMLLLFLQLADAFTFVPLLVQEGMPVMDAREWKGIYDRAQPLIQLVIVLASSVALSLLPAIVRADRSQQAIRQAMTVTLLISLAACVGLLVLFPDINRLFYLNEAGTGVLRLQMLNVVFVSLVLTSASALQGLGYATVTAGTIGAGLLIKVVLNVTLIPVFHVYGAALASVAAIAVIGLINLSVLKRKIHRGLFAWNKGGLLPSLAGMALCVLFFRWLYVPESRVLLLLWVLLLSGGGAFVYGFFLRQFRVLPGEMVPEQWRKWLIKGNE